MANLLLLSGGGSQAGKFMEYAFDWIIHHFDLAHAKRKTVLFIPYASGDHAGYAHKVQEALSRIGLHVLWPEAGMDPVALLAQADGVFIGGGNTFRLLDSLQRTGLFSAISARVREQGMPYMGASAGTNVACPTIMTTNDMPIIMPHSLEAMGLIPFQINPHYVDGAFHYMKYGQLVPYGGETRDDRIEEYHELNDTPVIGLREGTAIFIQNNKITLLGASTARFFQKGFPPQETGDFSAIERLFPSRI